MLKKTYNRFFSPYRKFGQQLKKLLGFTPKNIHIFRLAFKHSSKSEKAHKSNERLEYLGDAILDAIISDFLFNKYPLRGEGFLTEMRAKIVNRKRLGEIGKHLDLKAFLDYDKAYVNVNSTILGNALEALIGAIYLDAGYDKTKHFVFKKILKPYIDLDQLQTADINYKSRLFEWSQKYDRKLEFEVLEEKVQKNVRLFIVAAFIDGEQLGKGQGRSKKDAQKAAAKQVYERMNVAKDLEESNND